MPFQSVPDTAQLLISFSRVGASQPMAMTFNYQRAGGYLLEDLQALATAADGWADTVWKPIGTSDIFYLSSEARGLEFLNDQVAIDATSAGAGARAVAALPSNSTIAVKRSSGFTGRNSRGRVYWVQLAENDVTGDTVEASTRTSILAALNALDDAAFAVGWAPVIVSRFVGGVLRPTGVTFPVTDWSFTDSRVDSQRSRLPSGT